MISLTRPSDAHLQEFVAGLRGLAYSYPDVGASFSEPPAGYAVDRNSVRLGEGGTVFEKAREALRDWAMFRVGWMEVRPRSAPVEEGTIVALLGHRHGVWCAFACRIVRVVEERGPVESFGLAYGTLPGHALAGEERFRVRWDRREGSVWYDVLAFSRPAGVFGRLAYPLIRPVQRRFAPDSLRAMARAVGGEGRE